MKETKVTKGKVLIAEPFMLDPNFKRSVVLICDHEHKDGTVGFILNKPISMSINELIGDFPEFDSKVYYGGPVSTDTIHYVHNVGELLDDSIQVQQGLSWGGDFDKLKFLITNELIVPSNIRFFVGYSGWSKGQLEEEMKIGSWVVSDMDPNYAFKTKPKELWQKVLNNKGNTYTVIAQMPEGTSLN